MYWQEECLDRELQLRELQPAVDGLLSSGGSAPAVKNPVASLGAVSSPASSTNPLRATPQQHQQQQQHHRMPMSIRQLSLAAPQQQQRQGFMPSTPGTPGFGGSAGLARTQSSQQPLPAFYGAGVCRPAHGPPAGRSTATRRGGGSGRRCIRRPRRRRRGSRRSPAQRVRAPPRASRRSPAQRVRAPPQSLALPPRAGAAGAPQSFAALSRTASASSQASGERHLPV
ncbi:hypothetical protein DIPPA_08304 [Diplonema papillatum]|nr:hypothetical protein DIPPA_08304 [Diplonema papillatum]